MAWMKMDDESWYVWSGWWNGMDLVYEMEWKNIRTSLQSMTFVIHCSITSNFKFWHGNEVDGVWNEMNDMWNEVKYEWMNEMEYGWISEWNEMKWDES